MATGSGTIRVLHVEDEPAFAELAAECLEREDERIVVEPAESAEESLEELAETDVDCVVSDYEMPGMDGIELLEAVRADHPELPFILYTGKGSEEVASEAVSAGVTDYLQKSHGTEQYQLLANRIRNAVERHRAQRAIEQSEQQLRDVYERLTDGFFAVNTDWEYIYVNEEGARLTERTVEELEGQVVWEAFPELVDSPFEDALRGAMETGETRSVVEYYPPHDSWYDVRVYGSEEGISIYFQDVTDRKEQERELRRSHELAEALSTTSPDYTFVYNADGVYLDVITGWSGGPELYDPEELIGESLDDFLAADTAETIQGAIDAALETEELQIIEYDVETPGGTYWYEAHVAPLEEPYEGETAVILTARDITDRKESERELTRLKEEYEVIFDNARDSLFLIDVVQGDSDPEFRIRNMNRADAEALGVSPDAALGQPPEELFGEELADEFRARYRECLEAGESITYEEHLGDGDETRIFDTTLTPVEIDDEIQHIVGVGHDITERTEKEAQLARERRRFSTLYENFPEPTLTYEFVDGVPIIRAVNEAFEEVFGYSEKRAVGENVDDLVVPPEKTDEAERIDERVRQGELVDEELRRRTDEGLRDFWFRNIPLPADSEADGFGVYEDITERTERERELAASEERYRRLIETAPTPIFIYSIDGELIYANEAGVDFFGADDEAELLGSVAGDFAHPDSQADIEERGRRLIEEREPVPPIEEKLVDVDGNVKHAVVASAPVTFEGEPAIQAVATDISEQKRRERELEWQTKRFRTLFENTNDAVVWVEFEDDMPIVREANARFRELFEPPDESVTDRPIDAVVAGEDRRSAAKALSEGVRSGAALSAEVTRDTVDGERTFLWEAVPVEDPSDTGAEHGFAVYTDITDLRQRERELERYETIVEATGDPVYTLDASGHFTFVNEAFLEMTGYDEADLIDGSSRKVMGEEYYERGTELIRSLLAGEENRGTYEMELQTATGERIPCETHVALLPFEDEFRGTVGVLRDISARLEREQRITRERNRLEQFATLVSHDLRNPLNVASGRLELVREDCESEHLDAVVRAHDRMETLIDETLSLAKAGETIGEMERVALGETVEDCWHNVDGDSATLVTDTEASIEADSSRLARMLENLLRNAIEHGGPDVTITVGDLPGGFYVADDGEGIPPDQRDEVFEPGVSTTEAGTGFGLSIVREIADAHGWDVTVTAGEAGGARFEFTGVERA